MCLILVWQGYHWGYFSSYAWLDLFSMCLMWLSIIIWDMVSNYLCVGGGGFTKIFQSVFFCFTVANFSLVLKVKIPFSSRYLVWSRMSFFAIYTVWRDMTLRVWVRVPQFKQKVYWAWHDLLLRLKPWHLKHLFGTGMYS